MQDFKGEDYELHEQNFFFVQEVAAWMGGGFFDVKKLKLEFKRYQDDQHHSRVIKDVIYGQPTTNASHAEETLKLTEKIRKQVREQDPYPIMKHEFEEKALEYIFYQVAYSKVLGEM